MLDADKPTDNKNCFVIGPIGQAGSETNKAAGMMLHAVIKPALEPLGFSVKRADEDTDPGMINDRVIQDILHADLVVADLSELNPNAFYELGIRHSKLKPTIHIARVGTRLPFDNSGHRAVFVDTGDWNSIQGAKELIAAAAARTLQTDYKVSNPITQANASFEMQSSSDPKDTLIANLMERVQNLENSQKPEPKQQLQSGPPLETLRSVQKFIVNSKKSGRSDQEIATDLLQFGSALSFELKLISIEGRWALVELDGWLWRLSMTDGVIVPGPGHLKFTQSSPL